MSVRGVSGDPAAMNWSLRGALAWIPLGAITLGVGAVKEGVASPLLSWPATVAFWVFLVLTVASFSYGAVWVLEWGLYGVCLIIVLGVEGVHLIDRVIDEYGWHIDGLLNDLREWATAQLTSEPTALERVKNDYARGELSDLEMEEEIAAALQEGNE